MARRRVFAGETPVSTGIGDPGIRAAPDRTSEPVASRAGDRCAEIGVPAVRFQPLWELVQRDPRLGSSVVSPVG